MQNTAAAANQRPETQNLQVLTLVTALLVMPILIHCNGWHTCRIINSYYQNVNNLLFVKWKVQNAKHLDLLSEMTNKYGKCRHLQRQGRTNKWARWLFHEGGGKLKAYRIYYKRNRPETWPGSPVSVFWSVWQGECEGCSVSSTPHWCPEDCKGLCLGPIMWRDSARCSEMAVRCAGVVQPVLGYTPVEDGTDACAVGAVPVHVQPSGQ